MASIGPLSLPVDPRHTRAASTCGFGPGDWRVQQTRTGTFGAAGSRRPGYRASACRNLGVCWRGSGSTRRVDRLSSMAPRSHLDSGACHQIENPAYPFNRRDFKSPGPSARTALEPSTRGTHGAPMLGSMLLHRFGPHTESGRVCHRSKPVSNRRMAQDRDQTGTVEGPAGAPSPGSVRARPLFPRQRHSSVAVQTHVRRYRGEGRQSTVERSLNN